MIVVALGLVVIGVFDLVRRGSVDRPRSRAGIFVVLAAAAVVGGGLIGGWTVWVVVPVAAAALWAWTMPDTGRGRWGLWPIVALAVLAAVGVWAAGPTGAAAVLTVGPVVTLSLPEVLLVVGAALFLLESSNIVVRVALLRDRDEDARAEAERAATSASVLPRRRWRRVRTPEPPAPAPALPVLKGGRIIGPLERLLMATLILAGGYVLIAALIAAKGIVRFPEISRDSAGGNRAEYFLVGSMVSWTIAFAAAGLVWVAVVVVG